MSLYAPTPVLVAEASSEVPGAIDGVPVETVREEWVVEDRWWTPSPLRRRYFELALADGRCVVVFRELEGGRWFAQRA
jgi:hypothetical protein